jgi:hypothetical protein
MQISAKAFIVFNKIPVRDGCDLIALGSVTFFCICRAENSG